MKYQIKKSQIAAVLAAMAALSASPNIRAQVTAGENQYVNGNGNNVNIDTTYAATVAALNGLSAGGGISATVQTNVTLLQGLSATYTANLAADTGTYNGWVSTVATDNANITAQNAYIASEQAAAAASLLVDPFDTSGNWAAHNANANAALTALPGMYTTLSADSVSEAAASAVVAQDNQKINLITTVTGPSGAVAVALANQASAGAQFTNLASAYAAGPSTASLESILTTINTIPSGTSAMADTTAGNAFTAWGASAFDIPALQALVQQTNIALSQLPVTSQAAVDSAMELASNGAWERYYIQNGNSAIISVGTDGAIHIGPHSLITIETTTGTGGTVQQLYAHDATGGSISIDVTNGSTLLLNGVSAASLNDVSSAVSGEASARAAADTTLQTNINNEASTRAANDASLQTNINNEASTRAANDTSLSNQISGEAVTRATNDTALSNQISGETSARIVAVANEASARTAGDTSLSNQISAETSARIVAVANEASARTAGDTSLSNQISAEAVTRAANDTSLSNQISAETSNRIVAVANEASARTAGDTSLSNQISGEAVTRAANDTSLSNQISGEAVTRAANDTSLSNQISAETSNRIVAVAAEATTRAANDTLLSNQISGETATRIANVTALSTQIVAETTRATGAETVLQTNINNETSARVVAVTNEASARTAGDTALSTQIVAETTRATGAETVLQTNITNEASARTAADTAEANTRSAAIATEAAARIAGDATLTTNINNEVSARTASEAIINQNINKLRRGVAMSAALQTPTIDAGKNSALSLGVSNYDGQTGIAAGFAHRAGEGVILNLSVASTSNASETVVRGGINWSW